MLESIKIANRASEIKVRLIEIAGAEDALTDEVRTELTALRNEATDVELKWQAASAAEGVRETENHRIFGGPRASGASIKDRVEQVHRSGYRKAGC